MQLIPVYQSLYHPKFYLIIRNIGARVSLVQNTQNESDEKHFYTRKIFIPKVPMK